MALAAFTAPNGWVGEVLDQVTRNGLVEYEYWIWLSQASKDKGDPPYLMNNHKSQMRTAHQRVREGANKGLLHRGDGTTPIEVLDPDAFKSDSRFIVWTATSMTEWRRGGIRLAPFIHKNYWGVDEALDPQWLRETFTVSLDSQREQHIFSFIKRAAANGWSGDRRGTTLNLQVGASADDADQTTANAVSVIAASATIDADTEHFGSRWQNVTIAQGSTIDSAFHTSFILGGTFDEPQHQIRGEDADDAAVFTTGADSIDARARTTATVNWDSTNLGAGAAEEWEWGSAAGAPTAGADVKAIVQEITDRGGWTSGNSMVFIFEQHTLDGARDLGVNTYDGASTRGAKLDIDYTAPVGGTAVKDMLGMGVIAFAR